jgi:hypothetical protein
MNFPAAENSGLSSAAVSAAHAAIFSDSQTRAVPAQASTPKLQPITSHRARTHPVFTNPFASHPAQPSPEAEGTAAFPGVASGAFPNPNNIILSGDFTPSDSTTFGHNYHLTPQVGGGTLREGQQGDPGKVGEVNVPYSSKNGYRRNLYGDVDDELKDEDDGDKNANWNEELEIGLMFPRMSLDADADAEGESEDEGERKDM